MLSKSTLGVLASCHLQTTCYNSRMERQSNIENYSEEVAEFIRIISSSDSLVTSEDAEIFANNVIPLNPPQGFFLRVANSIQTLNYDQWVNGMVKLAELISQIIEEHPNSNFVIAEEGKSCHNMVQVLTENLGVPSIKIITSHELGMKKSLLNLFTDADEVGLLDNFYSGGKDNPDFQRLVTDLQEYKEEEVDPDAMFIIVDDAIISGSTVSGVAHGIVKTAPSASKFKIFAFHCSNLGREQILRANPIITQTDIITTGSDIKTIAETFTEVDIAFLRKYTKNSENKTGVDEDCLFHSFYKTPDNVPAFFTKYGLIKKGVRFMPKITMH
jgi:hypothetical protein